MSTSRKFPEAKSFFQLLAFNYLMFIGAVLFIFLGIYLIYCSYARHAAPIPDPESLKLKAQTLEDRQLDSLSTSYYLGPGSGFIIADSTGNLLYSSGENLPAQFTPGELACIPRYDSDTSLAIANLPESSPNGQYLITQLKFGQQGETVIDGYLFLDQELNVLSGTIATGRSSFTPQEFQYLKGQDESGRLIFRTRYQNPEGEIRQMVFFFRNTRIEGYQRVYHFWNRIWLLAIPACLLAAAFCIRKLTEKTKSLLEPLNQAILSLSQGKDSHLDAYHGPAEFAGIARNFLQMEERLRESEYQRQQLDESRRQLMADISHDLKTPAAVISGYACALRDEMLSGQEQQRCLDTLVQKSRQISSLLSQLHEYSRLDHPAMPIHLSRVDLCGLVREYFAGRYQELELAGYPMEADIPDSTMYVMADRQLLIRCMENLVQNTLSYNPPGTTLWVSVRVLDGYLQLLLGDNGSGIPQNIRQSLFDPFVTGNQARSGNHGSGLGLSIVKKIVELHGGKIALLDCSCWSTCFCITLPPADFSET